MDEYTLPLIMVSALIAGIMSGYPVAFLLGGLGIIFALIGDLPFSFLGVVVSRVYSGIVANWLLLAVPLFVFMGLLLEKSGIGARLLKSLEKLMGKRRGGLAVSVTLVGIIMAASTGIIGASVVLLGVLALPVMLNQGYNKELAAGTVLAASTLGVIIPPSIMLVLMGSIMQVPVGDMFVGAMVPGVMLGALYIIYILILARVKPEFAPPAEVAIEPDERHIILQVLYDLLMPIALILSVLGSIITGIATPTEAAAIGAFGALLMAAFGGNLSVADLRDVTLDTNRITSMILLVLVGATCFSVVFGRLGGDDMIEEAILSSEFGPYGTLLVVMGVIFFLGFFLDWIQIAFVVLPLVSPVIAAMDFGLGLSTEETLLWFGILVALNLQSSFLTPPFGYALFYLKGIAPPGLTMGHIYRAVIPFVIIQLSAVALAIFFPDIIIGLPRIIMAQ